MTDKKRELQERFGRAAAAYVTSKVHARGEGLKVLLELTGPQPEWRVLDVGTGGGHTALTFAPHVAEVIATDLTPEMLAATQAQAEERGLTNVTVRPADAEALPFDAGQFDLVTSRLALHHFPNPRQALAEMARVARSPDPASGAPGGLVALADNVVPPNREDGAYINACEKLRDPAHHWCYPLPRLASMFEQAGLAVEDTREFTKEIDFGPWVARQGVPEEDQIKLRKMLLAAPPGVKEYLTPRQDGDKIYFTLHEAVIVGRKG
ncbi:MAG: class I SAM-dependent methyltransferase [Anaerolineae bacterium]